MFAKEPVIRPSPPPLQRWLYQSPRAPRLSVRQLSGMWLLRMVVLRSRSLNLWGSKESRQGLLRMLAGCLPSSPLSWMRRQPSWLSASSVLRAEGVIVSTCGLNLEVLHIAKQGTIPSS